MRDRGPPLQGPARFGGRAQGEHMAGQLPARNPENTRDTDKHGLLSALTIPVIFGRVVR